MDGLQDLLMDLLFERRCAAAHDVAQRCTGGFIDRVNCTATASHSVVDIVLTQVPQFGEVVFSLERLWWVTLQHLHAVEGSFVDDLRVTRLPSDARSWPGDAERFVARFPGMPDLVRLHLVGPAELNVVASIITVVTSPPGWPRRG